VDALQCSEWNNNSLASDPKSIKSKLGIHTLTPDRTCTQQGGVICENLVKIHKIKYECHNT
jgi:hypothetical protein